MDVNEELKFLWKFQKKNFFLGGGEGGRWGGGGSRRGQGGCERRIEVFVKIQKKIIFWGGGGWVGGGSVGGVGVGLGGQYRSLWLGGRASPSGSGGRGFESRPRHTKGVKNGTSGYLAWCSAL